MAIGGKITGGRRGGTCTVGAVGPLAKLSQAFADKNEVMMELLLRGEIPRPAGENAGLRNDGLNRYVSLK
jgi:hypothetical protein